MSGKGKKDQEIEDATYESISGNGSAMELGYLTAAILDYYEATEKAELDEGESWKAGSGYDNRKSSSKIPSDLDEEIKKAFMTQVKRFSTNY